MPVVENWMLGMCDVANCINDVRDPETIRFSDFQNSKTYGKTKFTFIKFVYPLTINLINNTMIKVVQNVSSFFGSISLARPLTIHNTVH